MNDIEFHYEFIRNKLKEEVLLQRLPHQSDLIRRWENEFVDILVSYATFRAKYVTAGAFYRCTVH